MTRDISIIVPAYNCAPYLGATLASALGQTGVDHEVVVVDNASTDDTPEVIASFAHNPRLVALRVAGGGCPRARNTAIAAARGRYIGFLDGDDVWLPNKAARHVRAMDDDRRLDLTTSWYRIIDEHGAATGRAWTRSAAQVAGGISLEGLLIENFCGNCSTVVCRADALRRAGPFDETLTALEDLDMWLRVAGLRPDNLGLVPELLTAYRVHGDQMTADWRNMNRNWEMVLERARARHPHLVAAAERRARARHSRYLAYIAYCRGERAAARRLVLHAWAHHPWVLARDRRAWLTTAAIAAGLLPRRWHDRLAQALIRNRARHA